jgi:DNA mismatch repair protein MutL
VREAVRAALAVNGFLQLEEDFRDPRDADDFESAGTSFDEPAGRRDEHGFGVAARETMNSFEVGKGGGAARQESIEFGPAQPADDTPWRDERAGGGGSSHASSQGAASQRHAASALDAIARDAQSAPSQPAPPGREPLPTDDAPPLVAPRASGFDERDAYETTAAGAASADAGARVNANVDANANANVNAVALPPLNSAARLVRDAAPEALTPDIRPLGQLEESFIIATDAEGLLLIDQHVAHERILFDKYRRLEQTRAPESQQLLVPETFDLTPAQAAAFDEVSEELERLGFGLMRLSGRTVAVRAVPADLPASEARNLLAEILETVDAEKRGRARATLRDEVAASLACRAAIKINTPLTVEKMRWLIQRLLLTSSPTTCPHGRPIILRLTKRDIERGFHRP